MAVSTTSSGGVSGKASATFGLAITEKWIRERLNLHKDSLDDVRSLSLPGSYSEKITHLGRSLLGFTRLKHLDLSRNAVESLDGLQDLLQLETLNLYYNNIPSLNEVFKLGHNSKLKTLDLRLNPVTKNEPDYRLFVIHLLVNIRKLDDRGVRDSERKAAIMHFTTDQANALEERLHQMQLERLSMPEEKSGPQPRKHTRTELVKSLAPRSALDEDTDYLLDLIAKSEQQPSTTPPSARRHRTSPSLSPPTVMVGDYPARYSHHLLQPHHTPPHLYTSPPITTSTSISATALTSKHPQITPTYCHAPNNQPHPPHHHSHHHHHHHHSSQQHPRSKSHNPRFKTKESAISQVSSSSMGRKASLSRSEGRDISPAMSRDMEGSDEDGVVGSVGFRTSESSVRKQSSQLALREVLSLVQEHVEGNLMVLEADSTFQDKFSDWYESTSKSSEHERGVAQGACQVESLQSEIDALQSELRSMESHLREKDRGFEDKQTRIKELEDLLTMVKSESAEMSRQLKVQLERAEQLSRDRMSSDKLEKKLRKTERDMTALQEELQSLQRENVSLKDSMESMPTSACIEKAHRTIGELESEVRGLKSELLATRERHQLDLGNAARLQEVTSMLQESHRSLVVTNDHLLQELEANKQKHTQEVQQMNHNFEQLRKTVQLYS